MYQALYRKYRPRRFGDVAGQEHITETLRRQIINDRLSHAYLFVGTRGTGKTTCAKILSRAVNCLYPENGEPCNKCTSCIGIEEGSILDVLELDAASNNSVDNVRALRDEAIYTPATVKKRVYIVDEVHMLSISAFNALLKILEEPPEHILFILATTELHKVPATILSRCQKFLFKRLSTAVLSSQLHKIADGEGLKLTDDAAGKLAALADGSMRDCLSLLDQCASGDVIDLVCVQNTIGLAGPNELLRLIEAVSDRDIPGSFEILNDLYNEGRDMASLLGEMAALTRDLLVYKLSPNSGLLNAGFDRDAYSALSENLTPEHLFYCLDVLKSAVSSLSRGGSSKLAVEICLIRMCDERLSDDPTALLARISRLETGAVSFPDNVNAPVTANAPSTIKAPDTVDVPSTTSVPDTNDVQNTTSVSNTVDVPDGISIPAATIAPDTVDTPDETIIPAATTTPDTISVPDVADDPDTIGETNAGNNDFWSVILKNLSNEPSVHALLSDSSKVKAQSDGGSLIITVADFFTADIVKSEFLELLKETASKVLGREIIIHVEVGNITTDEGQRSKLESLNAFGIVNFE